MRHLHRWLILALTLVAACLTSPEPVLAQTIDTVGWTHDSTAVGLDTASWTRDSTPVTTWHYDSTAVTAVHWVFDSTPITQPHVTPPPVLAGSCPNEPTGLRLVSDRHFATVAPDWVNVSRFTQVQDVTAPDGDGWVGQQTYGPNNIVGSATMASYLSPNFQGKGLKTIYTCFWTKLDPGFTFSYGGGFFGTKQYWFLVGPASGENKVFTNFYAPDPGNGNGLTAPVCLGLVLQGVPSEPSHGTWCAKPAGLVQRGVWYRVEMLGQMNSTAAASDGSVTMWVNGAVVANRTGIRFTQVNGLTDYSHGSPYTWTKTTDPAEWYGTKWNNTLGGGSAFCTSTKPTAAAHPECYAPKTQYIRFDAQRVLVH